MLRSPSRRAGEANDWGLRGVYGNINVQIDRIVRGHCTCADRYLRNRCWIGYGLPKCINRRPHTRWDRSRVERDLHMGKIINSERPGMWKASAAVHCGQHTICCAKRKLRDYIEITGKIIGHSRTSAEFALIELRCVKNDFKK